MKKKSFLAMLLCVVLFCSCDKDGVPGNKVRIDIQTSAFDVVKNLKDAQGKIYFTDTLPQGYRMRVHCFVYRYATSSLDHDTPVSMQVAYLDDVTAVAGFSVETDPGDFRVITTADLVKMSGERVAMAYNDIANRDRSVEVTVKFKNNGGYLNAVGTVASERFSLEGGSKKEVNLEMQPIGALITTTFFNVDASKSDQIIYRVGGADYSYGLVCYDKSVNVEVLARGTEEIIKPVAGKDVYHNQRYVIANGNKMEISWAGIGYFNNKNFLFTPGINNFARINFMTDEVVVSDDYMN